MAEVITTGACASAAAAASNACGMPPGASIVAALLGAAFAVWLQHGRDAEFSARWLINALMCGGTAAGFGLSAAPLAPMLWSGFALVPGFMLTFLCSLFALLLIAAAGRWINNQSPPASVDVESKGGS